MNHINICFWQIFNVRFYFYLKVALVEEGLAAVHPTADRSEYYKQLKSAEDQAKQKKLRRWKNFVEEIEQEQKIEEDRSVIML